MSSSHSRGAGGDKAVWDGAVYGENTGHHRAFDDELVADLELTGTQRVLDIGCGVGDFSHRLATLVPQGHVVGIDKSASMIQQAAGLASDNLSFSVVAAQDLGQAFADDQQFDVIVSVAALHWVPGTDHASILQQCYRLLRPGGRLVLSFGGQGNVASALELVNTHAGPLGGTVNPWFFPGPDQYEPLVADAGFSNAGFSKPMVRLVEQRHAFATFADLEGWFDSQFLIAFGDPLDARAREVLRTQVLEQAEADLRRPDGTFDQDYVRLVVQATK